MFLVYIPKITMTGRTPPLSGRGNHLRIDLRITIVVVLFYVLIMHSINLTQQATLMKSDEWLLRGSQFLTEVVAFCHT